MLDVSCLKTLADELAQSISQQDIENILALCENNDEFIRSIEPSGNAKTDAHIRHFITQHQAAMALIQDVHSTMQEQLFQSTKTRKGVSQYEGVKYAK